MTPRLRRASTSDRPVKVLLLHGLGCRTSSWDRYADQPADDLELWDVELPWHGVGDSGWSYREDSAAQLVEAVPGGFDGLVAHSFAATLLTEAFATGLLEPVPAVLVNAFYRPSEEDFDWPTISHYLNDFHLIFAEALRDGDSAHLSEKHRSWMANSLRDQVGPYGWSRFFQSYLRSPSLDLSAVTAPQLVLCGDGDIATRVSDGQALAAALPAGRFEVLPGCGHFPMTQAPDRFARSVRAFLTRTHTWS